MARPDESLDAQLDALDALIAKLRARPKAREGDEVAERFEGRAARRVFIARRQLQMITHRSQVGSPPG